MTLIRKRFQELDSSWDGTLSYDELKREHATLDLSVGDLPDSALDGIEIKFVPHKKSLSGRTREI